MFPVWQSIKFLHWKQLPVITAMPFNMFGKVRSRLLFQTMLITCFLLKCLVNKPQPCHLHRVAAFMIADVVAVDSQVALQCSTHVPSQSSPNNACSLHRIKRTHHYIYSEQALRYPVHCSSNKAVQKKEEKNFST